jgi:hypothetical protein
LRLSLHDACARRGERGRRRLLEHLGQLVGDQAAAPLGGGAVGLVGEDDVATNGEGGRVERGCGALRRRAGVHRTPEKSWPKLASISARTPTSSGAPAERRALSTSDPHAAGGGAPGLADRWTMGSSSS